MWVANNEVKQEKKKEVEEDDKRKKKNNHMLERFTHRRNVYICTIAA